MENPSPPVSHLKSNALVIIAVILIILMTTYIFFLGTNRQQTTTNKTVTALPTQAATLDNPFATTPTPENPFAASSDNPFSTTASASSQTYQNPFGQ